MRKENWRWGKKIEGRIYVQIPVNWRYIKGLKQNKCFFNDFWALQVALVVKNLLANVGDIRGTFDPWVGNISWRRAWQPTPVFLPGESQGQRSLAGYSPWVAEGAWETATTSKEGNRCANYPLLTRGGSDKNKSQLQLKWVSMHTKWLLSQQKK